MLLQVSLFVLPTARLSVEQDYGLYMSTVGAQQKAEWLSKNWLASTGPNKPAAGLSEQQHVDMEAEVLTAPLFNSWDKLHYGKKCEAICALPWILANFYQLN